MKGADPDIDRYLLPGLPTERIGARYAAAAGHEIDSGIFASRESLVANAFDVGGANN
jgi:hypothetical protein